jgi:hypothetical protein
MGVAPLDERAAGADGGRLDCGKMGSSGAEFDDGLLGAGVI